MAEIEIPDLDNSMKLLVEYTTRTREMYTGILKQRRQKSTSYFVLISGLLFTGIMFALFLNIYSTGKNDIYLAVLIGISFMTVFIFIFLFISKRTSFDFFSYDQLFITIKQLKQLIVIISQYSEHNNNRLLELKKFELNLKLIEAEEILKITEKLLRLDRNSY